jgi:cytochrome c biogenesis protein CcdA
VAQSRTGRWRVVIAFILGLLICYLALAFVVAALATAAHWSSFIYVALTAAFAVCGLSGLVVRTHCEHAHVPARPSMSLLLGAGSGLVFSPCCSPLVAAIGGIGGASGHLGWTFLCVSAFVGGHIAPIGFACGWTGIAAQRWLKVIPERAFATISSGLLLGLAGYFGLLA